MAQQYSELQHRVTELHGSAAGDELDVVFRIAERVHRGERRRSGDLYITHPLEVAGYITDWQLPLSCIKAAIAHDIPDTGDIRDFEDELGPTVVAYVQAVTALEDSINVHRFLRDGPDQGQFNRHVALLKVADRLHNARTWQYVPLAKAQDRARQTLALVAPAAAALNIPNVAEELRALSIATLSQPLPLPTRTASSLLASAVQLLPVSERERYRTEWEADLRHLDDRRDQGAMALGLLYSALAIRRQFRH